MTEKMSGKKKFSTYQYLNCVQRMADFEVGKAAAAAKAVETHIKSGDLVGIGSGSTIVYAVNRLAELVSDGTLVGIQCVPTSFQVSQDDYLLIYLLLKCPYRYLYTEKQNKQ